MIRLARPEDSEAVCRFVHDACARYVERTTLPLSALCLIVGCTVEQPEPSKTALAAKFADRMSFLSDHEECIRTLRKDLPNPASPKFTAYFTPDQDWVEEEALEAEPIWFSVKVVARNRGGNIVPSELICRYNVNGDNLTFAGYELRNGL